MIFTCYAIRLFLRGDDNRGNNRILIGMIFGLLAASGLAHIAAGNPSFTNSREAMANGGGALGFVVSSPLVVATTVYVAVPLLVLLGLFSLLVVTATPVRAIPKRLTDLYYRLTGGARPGRTTEVDSEGNPVDLVADNSRTSDLKPVMGAKRRSRKKKTDIPDSDKKSDDDAVTKAYDKAYIHEDDVSDEEADTTVIDTEPKLKPGQRRPTKAEREVAELKKTIGMDDDANQAKKSESAAASTPVPVTNAPPPPPTEQLPNASNSSRWPATSPTPCPPRTTSSPDLPRRNAPRPTTASSKPCAMCSSSSRSTPRSPDSPVAPRSPATRWSWAPVQRSRRSRRCRRTSPTQWPAPTSASSRRSRQEGHRHRDPELRP